jgi:anti-sigma regulatory factor (Ser/Thr protein kinase)
MPLPPTEATISTPATLEGLDRVTEAFEAFAADHGIPDSARRATQIVLDELLSNTARCGKVGEREPAVTVSLRLEGRTLDVEIVDDGIPYDPLGGEEPDTTLPLEERPVGGLGVMLVTRLVDEIRYDGEGGRNRVRFRKRLDP